MEFRMALLAVKDVEISKRFYETLFGQTVVLDLGKNVTFSGGFGIQEDFARLTGIDPDVVVRKSGNMELYFEVDDFDAFLRQLNSYPDVRYVHPPLKHEWQQRVVRIYDPDDHMIEIGESMAVIARRYLDEGYSVDETSTIIQHPREFVERCKQAEQGPSAPE